MANTISTKIQIEGEKEYKQSIKNINQETKTLDAQIKEVASRFDEETDAMEKAKETTDLLQQKKQALEKELELMQTHLEDVTDAYGDGSMEALKLEEQIAKVETQLNNTNSALSENQSVLDGVDDSADGAVDSLQDVADAESDVGTESTSMSSIFGGSIASMADTIMTADITNIIGGVVDMVVAIGTAAIEAQRQYEEMIGTIGSKTGMTGELARDFVVAAQNLYASFPDANASLEDITNTVANLNTWFGINADQVDEWGTRMLTFSKVTGEDAAGAVETLAKTMATWDIDVDNSSESLAAMNLVMDKLQVASENCNVSVSTMADSLRNDKAYADELGISMDDLLGMYVAVERSGGDLSEVSASLKTAYDKLKTATEGNEESQMSMKDAWKEVSEIMEDSDDTTDALNTQIGDLGITLEDVFGGGKKAAKIVDRFTEGGASAAVFTAQISSSRGEIDKLGIAATTTEDKVARLTRTMKNYFTNARYPSNGDYVDLGEGAFAKAMHQPYIFSGRQSITVGEAGPEVLVGKGYFDSLLAGATTNNYEGASVNVNVYGAVGQDVSELAALVSEEIGNAVDIRRRAM